MIRQPISKLKVIIPEELQLVTSIWQFCKRDGSRRLDQPYWISSIDQDSEGNQVRVFQFFFMKPSTDSKELNEAIVNCCVWTRPNYIQKALEYFPEKFEAK